MEDLNKHQLILLTLLVSFITSIATGIITFTLLQEAPVAVTNTINRVVEKTIEKSVPDEGGKTIIKEVQVVNEEDLVLESIDKSAKSIIRIKSLCFDGVEVVTGIGLVVADGIVVTDAQSFVNQNSNILFDDGKSFGVSKSYTDNSLVFLKVGKATSESYTFYPAILGNSDTLKLGQTIIAIGGKQSNSVSIGRISQIQKNDKAISTEIISDIAVSKSQLGSPIINTSGEIVGIEKPINESQNFISYIPISAVKSSLKTALAELAK